MQPGHARSRVDGASERQDGREGIRAVRVYAEVNGTKGKKGSEANAGADPKLQEKSMLHALEFHYEAT